MSSTTTVEDQLAELWDEFNTHGPVTVPIDENDLGLLRECAVLIASSEAQSMSGLISTEYKELLDLAEDAFETMIEFLRATENGGPEQLVINGRILAGLHEIAGDEQQSVTRAQADLDLALADGDPRSIEVLRSDLAGARRALDALLRLVAAASAARTAPVAVTQRERELLGSDAIDLVGNHGGDLSLVPRDPAVLNAHLDEVAGLREVMNGIVRGEIRPTRSALIGLDALVKYEQDDLAEYDNGRLDGPRAQFAERAEAARALRDRVASALVVGVEA